MKNIGFCDVPKCACL